MHKLLVGVVVATLLSLTGCSPSSDGGVIPEQTEPGKGIVLPEPVVPTNVIIVLVDDATDVSCAQMPKFLPKVSKLLRDRGRCYENATVTSPACCPSRAVLQTSQMGHNNGVTRQIDAKKLHVEDTIQDDLTHAGYDTYGTGKFFNGVSPWAFESGKKSSGFATSDFWSTSKYYGYQLWDDELGDHVRPDDDINATVRTGMFLRTFIRKQADSGRSFFAYAAFKAPHTDNSARTVRQRLPIPTPKNRKRAVPPFRWNPENDTSDKLSIYQGELKPRSYFEELYKARTRSMYDVDDEMGKTFDLLREEGMLDDTAIIFTSDNGYHLGENGWETKGDPYQAAMDVPMLAWLPEAFGEGVVDRRPVGLIDISPTIYDLLDVAPEHTIDGHSLLTKFRRTGTFFELQNEKTAVAFKEGGYAPGRVPTWARYTKGKRTYLEYYDRDGTRIRGEFYRDLQFKKNLLAPAFRAQRPSPETLAFFKMKLRKGRACAGTYEQRSENPCP